MNNRRIKSKICKKISFIFCLILAVVFAINLVKPKRTFSPTENRMLEMKPDLSWSQIASGRFMKQYDAYKSDQFIGRDFWISLKTNVDLLLGKREAHGIYKGKQDYLFEKIKRPDEEALQENLDAMVKFQETYKDIPMKMLLVPNAANIMQDKLPTFAPDGKQKQIFDQVKQKLGKHYTWIDTTSILKKHSKEEIYYRTDHHWTTLGAYYAYQELCKVDEKGKKKALEFEPYLVTNLFNGTLSSSSGYERRLEENIHIYLPKKDKTKYVVEYVEEKKKETTVYAAEKLKEKDKYGLFFDGNHAMIDIKTTAKSNERLLLFKDSYANCFVPFLIPHYREIIMIDPRYYSEHIHECMKEHEITEVMFLYNGNTFVEDRNICGVLESK